MKRKLLNLTTAIVFLLCAATTLVAQNATHIIGGEIGYRFLGTGNYEITLDLYQSCMYWAEDFDDVAYIGIYDGEGTFLTALPVAGMEADTLPIGLGGDDCYSTPATVCVQHMRYQSKVKLGKDPAGGYYRFAYQRCCRGQRLQNIEKGGDTGAVYDILLTKSSIDRCNSSPVFRAWPPMSICADKPINFDHSASDSNDHKYDSLVYRLCTPVAGNSRKSRPMPIPPDGAPPFEDVEWLSGYSTEDPFGMNGDLSIHPQTGILSGTPTAKGYYVIGVCVEEYDRMTGELLSVTRRDFEVRVDECRKELVMEVEEGICDPNLKTYSVEVMTDGTLTTNVGIIESLGEDRYVVKNIPVNRSAILKSGSDNTDCVIEVNTTPVGCDCDDVDIAAPISGGDKDYCEGSAVPMLLAMVPTGQTVDWYDAEEGGNLLASGKIYQPMQGGVYYVEARDSTNSCTSSPRIPITLTANPIPSFVGSTGDVVCSEDLQTYQVTFTTDADLIQQSIGTLVDNDGGSYTIKDIPAGTDLSIQLANATTGCSRAETVPSPTCDCDAVTVNAPVSGGDQTICEGDPIPALMVTVAEGITVDWYDAAVGGNQLATDNSAYVPDQAGTYYAQARHIMTGCLSPIRTPVNLSFGEKPSFEVDVNGPICADDFASYSVTFSTDADQIDLSSGNLVDNGGQSYTISNIAANTELSITLTNITTGCSRQETIMAPTCECPDGGISPPISGGDQIICEGDDFPSLMMSVPDGILVDWYDAPLQGNLLLEASNTYSPPAPGVYYAEARHPETGCVSDNRTSIRLIQGELPSYELSADGPQCSEDKQSFSVTFTTNADVVDVSGGELQNDGDNFTVTGISLDTILTVRLINNANGCERIEEIQPPNCSSLCDNIDLAPPVSGGDKVICEGEQVPEIQAFVLIGETVDWYDSQEGGNLLAEGTNSLIPEEPGIYYAEARDLDTECTGSERTAVAIILLPLPSFDLDGNGGVCAEDMQSYSIKIYN